MTEKRELSVSQDVVDVIAEWMSLNTRYGCSSNVLVRALLDTIESAGYEVRRQDDRT